MSTSTPTGSNWAEAMQPLEDRRTRERDRAIGSERTMPRPLQAVNAPTRERARGRARRNWWMLLIPE
jgi:hypothetical protein